MRLKEAIRRVDELKHNTYTEGEKIKWLSDLDGNVFETIHKTHEGGAVSFRGYNDTTPYDTELLVPAPWDSLYLHFLEAQIDYYNGEYNRYNNSASRFTQAFREYADNYHRTHKPVAPASGFSQGGALL